MDADELGSFLLRLGLLLGLLVVLRAGALRLVPFEELPALCRQRVIRWNPLCRPIGVASAVVCAAGVVLLLAG